MEALNFFRLVGCGCGSDRMVYGFVDPLVILAMAVENTRVTDATFFLLNPQKNEWISQLATFDDTGGYQNWVCL